LSEYWGTPQGLRLRLEYLSEDLEWGVFNNAVQIEASSLGIMDFVMSGGLIPTSCTWCEEHVDRVYRRGQFMPRLPKHPNCLHYWDVVIGKGKLIRK
jgi:hypothetical protein